MALKLVKTMRTATRMHPALDVVNGVLYVAVQVETEDENGQNHIVDVVLTSEREMITAEMWPGVCKERGLRSYATVDLSRTGVRWRNDSIEAFLAGEMEAPTWRDAYDAIYRALDERIIVREPTDLTVLTLHIMATYCYVLFDHFPFLHLQGPPESGKSRAADAEAKIAFNGINQGDATPAVIFRFANAGCFTQVLKECDHLNKLDSDDRFVRQLQAAFSKSEALVDLAEAQQNKRLMPATYYAYSPRVFCSTKPFRSRPLKGRCIRLDFVKTPHADQDKLDRTMNDEAVWEPLRDTLYRLLLLKWREVAEARDAVLRDWRGDGAPKGRVRDKWIPLATIAKRVGDDVLKTVKLRSLRDMSEQQQDAAGSFEAMLMRFAAHFVRMRYAKPLEVTRTELWKAFCGSTSLKGPHKFDIANPPTWLKETGATVTVEQLQHWVKGPAVLLRELQRLKLVGEDAKSKADNTYYGMDRDNVTDTATEYLGGYVFDESDKPKRDEPASPRPDVTPTHDACLRPPYTEKLMCPTCGAKDRVSYFTHCDDGLWRCVKCGLKETACPRCEGLGMSAPTKPTAEVEDDELEDAIPF